MVLLPPAVGDARGFLLSSRDFALPYIFVLIRITFTFEEGEAQEEEMGADSRLLLAVTAVFWLPAEKDRGRGG